MNVIAAIFLADALAVVVPWAIYPLMPRACDAATLGGDARPDGSAPVHPASGALPAQPPRPLSPAETRFDLPVWNPDVVPGWYRHYLRSQGLS